MTFTLAEVLLLLLVIVLAVVIAVFARLAFQLSRTAAEVERVARNVSNLVPTVNALIQRAEGDLERIHALTDRSAKIADDVQAVTHEASNLSVALLRSLDGQVSPRVHAVVAGARSGFAAFKRAQNHDHDDDVEANNEEMNEEVKGTP